MSIDPISIQQPPGVAREPAAQYTAATATEPYGREADWVPDLAVDTVFYSIRVPVPARDARCLRCAGSFLAAGPTGHAGEQPICDLCLLENAQPLGMLLALAAVVRAFGVIEPTAGDDYREALDELAAFGRVYEHIAAKSGPARRFRFPDDLGS